MTEESMDQVKMLSSIQNSINNINKNKKSNNLDEDDNVNIGNMNLSISKSKDKNNNKKKENEIKIKKTFNDDFFDLSTEIPKKVNNDIVKFDNNINESNNDFTTKQSTILRRPSSEEIRYEEEEIIDENKNNNNDDFNDNEENDYNDYNDNNDDYYDDKDYNKDENENNENYNPLENNEEDNFKIEEDNNKEKDKYLMTNKTLKASEIDFSQINPEISKEKKNNNKISKNKISQSFNFNQPIKTKISKPITIPLTSKTPLPNQSSSSLNTNISISQNSLYKFLEEIKMEKYYNILNSNGFDDINLIIEQSKNHKLGITDNNLKQAGINLPGDRAKILIRIQDLSKNFNFNVPKTIYHCCDNFNNIQNDINIQKLNNWLKEINLSDYLHNFISCGYHSLDLLLMQMESNQPINDLILDELGIKIGHKILIMNKLKDDAINYKKKYKKKIIGFDRGTEKSCNECFIF